MLEAILIVDDDPDEANLIKRAALSLHPKSPVSTVFSAKELTDYLDGQGPYADRETYPHPALILLDLRMPGMNGFDALQWLKSHPRHSAIPVIVASSFDRQRDIRKSYQLGARTFLSKPITPEKIRNAVRSLRLPVEFED
jgi:CheY-like chemotaxis protein